MVQFVLVKAAALKKTLHLFSSDTLTFTGIPRYIQGQWMLSDESPQYEDNDGLSFEDSMWLVSPPEVVEVVTEGHILLTTAEPYVMKEQGELDAIMD